MENVYLPRYHQMTEIEKRFNLFRENLDIAKGIPNTDEEIKDAMSFQGTAEEFEELNESVSIEHLSQPDDIRVEPYDPSVFITRRRNVSIPRAALKLKTVAKLVESQGTYSEGYKSRFLKYNKYKHLKIDVDNIHADIEPYEEILLTIRVYEPFEYRSNSNVRMKPKLSQEFQVLGSQYLTELRDKIFCQCKFGPFFDISENPFAMENEATHKPFDHGFFYITDTFYNDTREPTIDYSEVIRNWAKKTKEIGEFHTASMEDIQFKELTVRLGYPQVYMHHGNCEHLIGFSDMRLIAQDDVRTRQSYPLLLSISSTRSIFCVICGQNEASVVVTNSTAHIHDPTYLCQDCFESYHYINGKKVGEFQAYRYYGNRPVTQP